MPVYVKLCWWYTQFKDGGSTSGICETLMTDKNMSTDNKSTGSNDPPQ